MDYFPKAGEFAPTHLLHRATARETSIAFPGIIDSMHAPYYNGRVKSIIALSSDHALE
jgi:hypothetical protein